MGTNNKNSGKDMKGLQYYARSTRKDRNLKISSKTQRKFVLKDGKSNSHKGSGSGPGNIFQRLIRSLQRNTKKILKNSNKSILIVVFPVVLVILIVFLVWLFTNKNAYEVFVDDLKVGTIAENKSITETLLYDTAKAKLVTDVGANVQIAEKVKIVPVHASKKEKSTLDYIVSEIYKKFTYKIEAAIIKVDGIEMAILSNEKEANDVLENLKVQYVQEDVILAEPPTFVENVTVDKKFVEKDEIINTDKAYQKLNQTTDTEKTYSAKSGDSYWGIAQNAGMTLDDLVAINPGLDISVGLKIGQEIILVEPKPMLSVKTVVEKKYTTVAEKPIEKRENKNEYKTYSKVIQQGRDGQKEVIEHIIRINGFETGETVPVSEKIIEGQEPVTEIIEVGTGQTVSRR